MEEAQRTPLISMSASYSDANETRQPDDGAETLAAKSSFRHGDGASKRAAAERRRRILPFLSDL